MRNLTDEELYECIKDKMTLDEAIKVFKEYYTKGMNSEEFSEEEALKSGMSVIILKHNNLYLSLTEELYNNLQEDSEGKYYLS